MNTPPSGPEPDDEAVSSAIREAAATGSKKFFALLGVAALVFLVMHLTPLGDLVADGSELHDRLTEEDGVRAGVYFVMLTAVLMAIGVPRLLFYVLGGFAFGFWMGLLLSLCGSLIGSFVAFRVIRWAGRDWVRSKFAGRRFFGHIASTRPTALSVALVRCMPLSNAIINAALAVSRVKNRAFLMGTLVGFLPQGVIAVLVGAGIADDVAWDGALQLAFAGLFVIAIYLFSRRRANRRLDQ